MKKILKIISCIFFLNCCSSNNEQLGIQSYNKTDKSMYIDAHKKLKSGEFEEANNLFTELDLMHPYSKWAIKGQLMSGFSLYQENKYEEAIFTLNKFINLNPKDKNLDYAHYLKGFCFYERINNVSRDQNMAIKAKETFTELKNKFPKSKYSLKAIQHIKLLNNQLAGYEMTIGKFYQERGKFIAAILRYKTIIKKYKNSAQIPETLFRIMECYLSLGIKPQAITLFKILNYNFPDSEWSAESVALMKATKVKVSLLENLKEKKKIEINTLNLDELDF